MCLRFAIQGWDSTHTHTTLNDVATNWQATVVMVTLKPHLTMLLKPFVKEKVSDKTRKHTNPIRTITRRQGKNSRMRQARKGQSKRPNQWPTKPTHQGSHQHTKQTTTRPTSHPKAQTWRDSPARHAKHLAYKSRESLLQNCVQTWPHLRSPTNLKNTTFCCFSC